MERKNMNHRVIGRDSEVRTNVVSVVGHPHLGTDEQDPSVVEDYPDVVDDVLVGHWPTGGSIQPIPSASRSIKRSGGKKEGCVHSDVADDILSLLGVHDVSQYFPGVEHRIAYSMTK
jgi:hypothetical protein